jgi:hypothetical protein
MHSTSRVGASPLIHSQKREEKRHREEDPSLAHTTTLEQCSCDDTTEFR